MDPVSDRAVHRWLAPAGRFVRIEAGAGAPLATAAEIARMDRAGYRRALLAALVAGFEEELEPQLGARPADEREAALEALYALVCAAHPGLAIEAVCLAPAGPTRPHVRRAGRRAGSQDEPAAPVDRAPAERALRRLAPHAARRLAERVLGQPQAIETVARAVRRAASGLPRRGPLASLLLLGPTGTGKTELARSLAEVLGRPFELLRVDGSELAAAHEYSRLIGAPPGYVGHERGGSLTERILAAPDAVVLIDEVEKAHPSLHRLLLQLLDEARLTDGKGRTADFSRAFVLLTSNCGTRDLARAREGLGFGARPPDGVAEDEILRRALAHAFAPEFLARLDSVVAFRGLSAQDAERVAGRKLAALARDVRARRARLSWTPAVARWVARQADVGGEGVRGIESVLARAVEPAVVDALLDACAGEWLRLSVRRGRPTVVRERA